MTVQKTTPTGSQFTAYEGMFRYFNRQLFGGKLPGVILNFSRLKRTAGFFAPDRWNHSKAKTDIRHEISINPTTLKQRPAIDVASTLVHEMCHLWQAEFGTPSRVGYHNLEWSRQMIAVGLMPTSTGAAGGARTGQHMTHMIMWGEAFALAFKSMPKDLLLPWACSPEPDAKKKAKKDKVKYSCAECGLNVWGKPELSIGCLDCGETLAEVA